MSYFENKSINYQIILHTWFYATTDESLPVLNNSCNRIFLFFATIESGIFAVFRCLYQRTRTNMGPVRKHMESYEIFPSNDKVRNFLPYVFQRNV